MAERQPWSEDVGNKIRVVLDCFHDREVELTRLAEQLERQHRELEKETLKRKQETEEDIAEQYRKLEEERRRFQNEIKTMELVHEFQESRIKLDVGGHHFTTSLQTLRKDADSMLAAMFSGRHKLVEAADGSHFIDRDGTHFRYILNYLRDGFLAETFPTDEVILREIQHEANYYQIADLVNAIEAMLDPPPPAPDFSQQEINDILATVTQQSTADQNSMGRLFSSTSPGKHVDFIFHNMTKSNLDFSNKNLSGLSFSHTTFAHNVSFEGAVLFNTCFYGCEFASHIVVDFSNADISGGDFRQCRCIQGGPNAFGGPSGSSAENVGGGFMYGSSCSSFAHLIETGHVKFTNAKHIGTKFDPRIFEIIKFSR